MARATKVKSLSQWFGSNRTLAQNVGAALKGCNWVGIPFAGGMSEVWRIEASSIVVNDCHRFITNLARVVKDDGLLPKLVKRLKRTLFTDESLADAQRWCKANAPKGTADLEAAYNYFVATWMNRGGKAGTDHEFSGRLSIRWSGSGGDSNTRYRSAIRGLVEFHRIAQRITVTTHDAFEFFDYCLDVPGNGIYCDPPFISKGERYKHSFTEEQHAELARVCSSFSQARVVMRFYDCQLVRDLYPESAWTWHRFDGRTQGTHGPEVLLVKGGAT